MNWIDVNDQLPEENVHVLSYSSGDQPQIRIDYMIILHNQPIWACRVLRDEIKYQVTHWLPLPIPPME